MLINKPLKIISLVCAKMNVTVDELKSKSRLRRIVYPKQVIMYLLRKKCMMTYMEIGRLMGNRDHTTVIHSIQNVKDLMSVDSLIKDEVNDMEELIEVEFSKEDKISPYVFAGIRF
jgi:chromosomal replication initiator protein